MRLLLVLVILTLSSAVSAKDMSSRLGFGYSNPFSADNLNSVTARYYSDHSYGFSVSVGVDTKDNFNSYGVMAKAYKIIFPEKHLNFYVGGGLGFLSVENAGAEDSGAEVSAFVGAEFFIPGLENLGFTFEAGLGLSTVDETRIRTIGDHPLRGGIIFYL